MPTAPRPTNSPSASAKRWRSTAARPVRRIRGVFCRRRLASRRIPRTRGSSSPRTSCGPRIAGSTTASTAAAIASSGSGLENDTGRHFGFGSAEMTPGVTNDAVFRWVMLAGFIAVVGITAPHRARAATREKLDRRKEGVFMLATLRPAGAALWLGIIAYIINPAWMAWSATPLPYWLRWSGAGFTVLAVALLAWTLPTLGRNL